MKGLRKGTMESTEDTEGEGEEHRRLLMRN